ncbi:MAG: ATP-binding protein [Betaproteobacteria bacterium]
MTDRRVVRAAVNARLFWGLLAMVMLAVLLLLGGQLWISYRDQIKTAEISTHNIASIFDVRLEATLRRTAADLLSIATTVPQEALTQNAVPRYAREINANLDGRMFNLEEMSGYRIHDAQGDTLYSSDNAHTVRVNIADRAYFSALRDHPDAGLVFSEVVTGRSTGRQVLVIIRGLWDKSGHFKGIVHGMINLDYYREQFKSLNLGEEGIVALRRSDNHALVVRNPEQPEHLNRPLAPGHPVVQHMRSGVNSLVLHYSVPDEAIARIMSIAKLRDYPFYFAVGVGRDEVLASWGSQVKVVAISTLLLFALVGLLIFRLSRMRKREAGMLISLAQSESQFRELAQMVPVGICHLDAEGRYTYVNDRLIEITGRKREELLGRCWEESIESSDFKKIRTEWGGSVLERKAGVFEFQYARPTGAVRFVQGEIQTEVDASGRLLGYIAAVIDITQRKLTEAELIIAKQQADSANMAKTRFLAAASHDLRQPIQAINLFRDALAQTELNAEQKTIAGFLSRSVHSLGELLYSLLDISKLDAGQVRPQLDRVKVEDMFKAVDAEFSSLACQKGLRFKLFYPFKDVFLVTDPSLLMSVLRNLIDNAFKYTQTGGVLVGFRKRGQSGIIQVWDTGVGIESEVGEQVFEECFQVSNPARDRTLGLGLGLSIARRMARLLSGDVRYQSRIGCGTVFEIVLPLAEPNAVAENAEVVQQRDAAAANGLEDGSGVVGWRVVVVDDDPMVAKSIELSLCTLGVRVCVFHSAEQALASPEIIGADFYISDFSLSGLDGVNLLDTIQQCCAAPINAVLVTGETSPERMEMASASPWRVLFKPVDLAGLLAVMRETGVTPRD